MKKTLFCLAATCLFAVGSLAQTSGSSAKSSGTQATTTEKKSTGTKSTAAKGKTLTGCVEAGTEANEYTLKTRAKKNIELVTKEDLKPHVGHTVKVTGNWTTEAGEMTEMGGGAEKGEHKEAKGERHFKVDKLDMVSDTCTMDKTSKTKSGTTPKP